MNTGSLLTLGAVAVGGYFLYETFVANALPADAMYAGSIAAGQTVTVGNLGAVTGPTYIYHSASTGLYYSNSTAPTNAQIPPAASVAPTAGGATAAGSNAATTTSTSTTTAAPSTIAATCTATRAAVAASGDPNFTASGGDFLGSPYHWQVYWNLQPGAPALNINAMFSDTTTPISGAAFCAAVASQGLSGYLAGMGCSDCGGSGGIVACFALALAAAAVVMVVNK